MSPGGADDRRTSSDLRFSSDVYSLDTIKKAAYRLSDRCSFDFVLTGTEIVCKLIFSEGLAGERIAEIERAFRNEVLDQDLRQSIAEETAPVRNAILAYAFSRTGLQGGE